MSTIKTCPNCGGRYSQSYEVMHKSEGRDFPGNSPMLQTTRDLSGETSADGKGIILHKNYRCLCCLDFGFIMFGRMFPPDEQWVKESILQYVQVEGRQSKPSEDSSNEKEVLVRLNQIDIKIQMEKNRQFLKAKNAVNKAIERMSKCQ